jgi:hypothetical protein
MGILVNADGDLLTFPNTVSGSSLSSPYDDQMVYVLDPATGDATEWGGVDGKSFIKDWVIDSNGKLWFALRENGKRPRKYVTEGVPDGTTDVKDRIAESDIVPWSLAAGPDGKLYVLEYPWGGGAIWLLTPGSGGGGGGKPPKKPK